MGGVSMVGGSVGGIGNVAQSARSIAKVQNNDNVVLKFSDYLNDALNKVNDLQVESEKISGDFALGKTDNIHEMMIAGEKANIALQLTMQIRTKVLDAYNEIMRIQI
jgi:flagellar hook-basal body complex protein FliE